MCTAIVSSSVSWGTKEMFLSFVPGCESLNSATPSYINHATSGRGIPLAPVPIAGIAIDDVLLVSAFCKMFFISSFTS